MPKETAPGAALLFALQRGWDVLPLKDIFHCGAVDCVPEFDEFTLDKTVTPSRVLGGQLYD
jgi:hypothetical protein